MSNIRDIIAKAIKEADTSYFVEDYGKQADNVLTQLQQHFSIVPKKPTEAMIKAGKEAIKLGKNKPSELVRVIFEQMSKAFKL